MCPGNDGYHVPGDVNTYAEAFGINCRKVPDKFLFIQVGAIEEHKIIP